MTITSEAISFGHAIYNGNLKLAVVETSYHAGLYRNGVGVCEPHAKESWKIKWCNSEMPIDEVKAVLEHVAKLPLYESPLK